MSTDAGRGQVGSPLTLTMLQKWFHQVWHTGAMVDGVVHREKCPGPDSCDWAMKVIDSVPPP